jgi:lysosomal alpha-mannosidase
VIKDEEKNLQVAVLNDRAQGGTSGDDGVIELMLHRRLKRDDGFGLDETLNEFEHGRGLYARGQHYLTFGSTAAAAKKGTSTSVRKTPTSFQF